MYIAVHLLEDILKDYILILENEVICKENTVLYSERDFDSSFFVFPLMKSYL